MPLFFPITIMAGTSLVETLVDRTSGTNIGDMTLLGGLAAVFDGTTSQTATLSAAKSGGPGYAGKQFSSGKIFSKAIVYGPNNGGFSNGAGAAATLTIYGKNSAPASGTDGTSLGTVSFTDTANESAGRTITSTDLVNTWTRIWVYVNVGGTSAYCSELTLYEMA